MTQLFPPDPSRALSGALTKRDGSREWAHKVIARHKAGETVSPYALQMAKNALNGNFRYAAGRERTPGEDDV